MASESPISIYATSQIDNYLTHISFPTLKYPKPTSETIQTNAKDALEYLTALQQHHICAVPFENLSLHYSTHRKLSLDKDDLYEKIVGAGNRRGGYCMENNLFFGTMLRSLGFDVVNIGGKVYGSHGASGWSHQIILLSLSSTTYAIDVGFGAPGPTHPMPLIHNQISKWGATDAEIRLTYQEPTSPMVQAGIWNYEYRNSPESVWKKKYCFTQTEFHPADFAVMNLSTSTSPTSCFTYTLLTVRFISGASSNSHTLNITGLLILVDKTVKRRVHGKTEVIAEFKTEDERVEALKRYFSIELSRKEREAIKGTCAEVSAVELGLGV
ncbi:hypothetical protein BJ875DRAFT_56148 [Amylocarpus encephaloides]|uniref:Arylamine N-acetyltransferase n=1 Tax=Amylocarpus encephaloides TaxID=45428 RepID=A0A9P7YSL3_9HELO|nr:hypothetical protein BJ875DRAFT_56148 [Amylocarpus encephaloides]